MEAFTVAGGPRSTFTPHSSDRYYSHSRSQSTATATSADTELATVFSSANTFASTFSTPSTIAQSHPSPGLRYHQRASPNMTTYYHYDGAGRLQSASTEPPMAQGNPGHLDLSYFQEHGDHVGAFLAQRALMSQTYAVNEPSIPSSSQDDGFNEPSWEGHGDTSQDFDAHPRHQVGDRYESYFGHSAAVQYPGNASTIGSGGLAAQSRQYIPYPDPEDIRHFHTLHGLLPFVQPERKLNALYGPAMDIVESDTGVVFAYEVPKKLLVLFLGRKVVNKLIRTIEREDNENWRGGPVRQELRIPPRIGHKEAFHLLISWMFRACQRQTMSRMQSFRVPKTTLTACALAEILELFGLHKDALRVNWAIHREHFTRPIFPGELEALWNCLGEKNRFVHAAIKVVGERLRVYEIGSTRQHPMWEEMIKLLEEYPPLKARVSDLELNEKYRPKFGTEWIKKLEVVAPAAKMAVGVQPRTPTDGETALSPPPEPSSKPTRKAAILRIVQ